MEILKNPILEPCVWKVSDFKSENEWTYTFSENQIFELIEDHGYSVGAISPMNAKNKPIPLL